MVLDSVVSAETAGRRRHAGVAARQGPATDRGVALGCARDRLDDRRRRGAGGRPRIPEGHRGGEKAGGGCDQYEREEGHVVSDESPPVV